MRKTNTLITTNPGKDFNYFFPREFKSITVLAAQFHANPLLIHSNDGIILVFLIAKQAIKKTQAYNLSNSKQVINRSELQEINGKQNANTNPRQSILQSTTKFTEKLNQRPTHKYNLLKCETKGNIPNREDI